MLVLSRKQGEIICFSGVFDADGNPLEFEAAIVGVDGNRAKVGITAPAAVQIWRKEAKQKPKGETANV